MGHKRPDCVGGSYVCARKMQKPRVAAVTSADGHSRWNCKVSGPLLEYWGSVTYGAHVRGFAILDDLGLFFPVLVVFQSRLPSLFDYGHVS